MMPSKKKKYNARFPAGRIKKIMQTDEDVGKVAQAVPVIISRALELFVESLLTKAMEITSAKNAKTLTPSHMKQCILSEARFDFLKDLVSNVSDVSACDDEPTTPQPAGISAPFNQVQKRGEGTSSSNTTTRGRGRGGHRSGRSVPASLSMPPSGRSRGSSQPSTPLTPTQPFYREVSPVNGPESLKKENVTRPPVIQHTANHRPLSNDSGDEEEESDDEDEDRLVVNGYGELANHSSKHLIIDDDYDA